MSVYTFVMVCLSTDRATRLQKLLSRLNPDQIYYLKGDNNYSWLHSTQERPIIMANFLKDIELYLPQFWRVHKSYLVNPTFVDPGQLPTKSRPSIRLKTGEVLPVARQRVEQIAQKMKAQVE